MISRHRGESIVIGNDVEIRIIDVRGDKVRLSFTAPKHIPVHRREIYDAIIREKPKKPPQKSAADKKIIDFQSNFLHSKILSNLVLSRYRGESIIIGDEVEFIIVDVRGDKVSLGITCPKDIPVHRREIYDDIKRKMSKKTQEEKQQSRKKVRKYKKRVRKHKEQNAAESDIAGPLQVYIDSDVYTTDEKGILLSLISELYSIQSHDRLVIDNMGMVEPVSVEAISPNGGN